MSTKDGSDKILDLLRPFAANWSGTLKRGDVVIPKDELPKLVDQLTCVAREIGGNRSEASDTEVFHALRDASRFTSLQDQVALLRRQFYIARRE
jgi:hypothetical protein